MLSDLPFPGIAELPAAGGQPDLHLRFAGRGVPRVPDSQASVMLELEGRHGPFLSAYQAGDEVRLHYHGKAEFVLEADRKTVTMYCAAQVPPEMLRHLFAGQVCSTFLARCGRPRLHATAVSIDDAAVAFVAPSGSGKSTLAAYFVSRGHALVSDDLLPLEIALDSVWTLPSFCQLRLWPDVARVIWRGKREVGAVYPGAAKLQVGGEHIATCQERRPLAAVYFVQRGEGAAPCITVPSKREVFLGLVSSVFGSIETTAPMLREEFTDLSALTRLVRARRLCTPKSLAGLGATYAAVVADHRQAVGG